MFLLLEEFHDLLPLVLAEIDTRWVVGACVEHKDTFVWSISHILEQLLEVDLQLAILEQIGVFGVFLLSVDLVVDTVVVWPCDGRHVEFVAWLVLFQEGQCYKQRTCARQGLAGSNSLFLDCCVAFTEQELLSGLDEQWETWLWWIFLIVLGQIS